MLHTSYFDFFLFTWFDHRKVGFRTLISNNFLVVMSLFKGLLCFKKNGFHYLQSWMLLQKSSTSNRKKCKQIQSTGRLAFFFFFFLLLSCKQCYTSDSAQIYCLLPQVQGLYVIKNASKHLHSIIFFIHISDNCLYAYMYEHFAFIFILIMCIS